MNVYFINLQEEVQLMALSGRTVLVVVLVVVVLVEILEFIVGIGNDCILYDATHLPATDGAAQKSLEESLLNTTVMTLVSESIGGGAKNPV